VVVAVVWWWLHRRLFRPLSTLIEGANHMARGDGGRLPIPEEEELAAFAGAVNRLASRVEEQVAAVETQRDRLEAILASLPDGVLVADREGRASSVNPAFRRLFGLGDQAIEGRSPAELVRHPQLAQLVERTLGSGESGRGEIERVAAGAERRSLSLQSSALRAADAAARPAGAIVVVRDVTAIERLSDVRRDFVANVSHELKTPLAAIRAYAETLRDGALDDPVSAPRFVDRVLAQCRRLQALLDDLLTLSRLEAVGEVERQPVDLAALVRRAVETAASATREKGVEVAVAAHPVPEVQGDADALERLVVNLLDNAIKYNRPGGRVELRLRPTGREIEIEIADTGIGIPADSLPRIFERFYRVDKARSREEGGTGLGLAIVKHVAQAHGGRVEVESEIGRGSTFRVRLPLSTPSPRKDRSGDSPSRGS
jgi:two-component system phosphate regulon sensor histidine kinase PhoR